MREVFIQFLMWVTSQRGSHSPMIARCTIKHYTSLFWQKGGTHLLSMCANLHICMFQIVTIFPDAAPICPPTGDQATTTTGSAKVVFVTSVGVVPGVKAQTARVPSSPPVARKRPSGDQETDRTGPACARNRSGPSTHRMP